MKIMYPRLESWVSLEMNETVSPYAEGLLTELEMWRQDQMLFKSFMQLEGYLR